MKKWPSWGWVTLCSVAIFALTYFALVQEAGSDPRLTLLVSQALLETGTVRLDAYQGQALVGQPFDAYVATKYILEYGGHYYYYFPVGPSVLAAPFVWPARLWGWDMARLLHNFALQNLLSALSCAAVFGLVYKIGRYYLNPRESLAISLVSVLGSGLVSTLGTALWSTNFGVIFSGLALLLLVRHESGHARATTPYLLGGLLFLAFFSRASAAAFIVVVFVYLLWQQRPLLIKTAVTAFLLLCLFLLWSRLEFGQWLPAYYTVARVQVARAPLWVGIYGNLFSPSRGLFIFSPFFALVFVGALVYWRALQKYPLFWMGVAWMGLHMWLVARAASWWGGYSFGPRLLVDVLWAPILGTIFLWPVTKERLRPTSQRVVIAVYLATGAFAVYVHSYQGLYNENTAYWNRLVEPAPAAETAALGDLFAWRYAQPLASNEMVCRLQAEKASDVDPQLAVYEWGTAVTPQADQMVPPASPPEPGETAANPPATGLAPRAFLPLVSKPGNVAHFTGWMFPEMTPGYRRPLCATAHIVLRLGEMTAANEQYTLLVTAASPTLQNVTILVNGVAIGRGRWQGPLSSPTTVRLMFAATLLTPHATNKITFLFPQSPLPPIPARLPFNLAFWELRLLPGSHPLPSPTPLPAYP